MNEVVAVHPDGTSLQRVADTDGGVQVLGVHGRGKTVRGVVGSLNNVVDILELGDRADRAEDLLLHDLHLGSHVREDGRLDEVALVAVALTTSLNRGTLVLTGLDVSHDTIILQLADLRTLEGIVGKWVADCVLLCALLECLDELVVDALLYENTRPSAAALAVVEVNTEVDPMNGFLDIGVIKNDVGRLASELERHLLQVGRGGGLHDLAAYGGGAGEGDLVDIHVRSKSCACGLAEARDQVEDSWGETSLLDELCGHQGGEGSLLSGLHHYSVTCRQRGADLPGPHEQGEVPGNNLATNTNLKAEESVSTYKSAESRFETVLQAPT